MKRFSLIIFNIALTVAIFYSLSYQIKHWPLDILNEQLNYLQSQDLFALESGRKTPCNNHWLKAWQKYTADINRYMASLSEPLSFQGFFYLSTGNNTKALAAYSKALAINPYYWANYYNVAIIYFKQGDYNRAIEYFQKAATSDMRLNVQMLISSKLYGDLIRQAKGLNINLQQRMEHGFQQSLLGLKASAYALQHGGDINDFNIHPILF